MQQEPEFEAGIRDRARRSGSPGRAPHRVEDPDPDGSGGDYDHQLGNWEPLLVPGLLQIPEYTHVLMRNGGVPDDEAQAGVAARFGRQAVLSRAEPPQLQAMVDEIVLRRVLGDRRVTARQLRHLVEAAGRPTVTLRVLPLSAGACSGLDGSFALFAFPRNRSVVYLDHKISGLFLEEAPLATLGS